MLKYNKKISENIGILFHFLNNEWKWKKTSTNNLQKEMSKEDRKVNALNLNT